jgi:hypothetical protein
VAESINILLFKILSTLKIEKEGAEVFFPKFNLNLMLITMLRPSTK